MAVKAMRLVGLDVHARQTHAAILHLDSGELGVSRLQMAPLEVSRAGAPGAWRGGGVRGWADRIRAARAARDVGSTCGWPRGVDPKGSGDRVETDA